MAITSSTIGDSGDGATCRATSPSSWTATAAGRSSASCRASPATRGVEAVRATVQACVERGVEYLTLFAFSSENWRRPAEEVAFLMQLFVARARAGGREAAPNGVRFRVDRRPRRASSRRIVPADRAGRSAHRGQHAPDAHHRRELRRPLGHPAGASTACSSERAGAGGRIHGSRSRAVPRDELRARARSVHPHRRRAAHQQLPAVAARVHASCISPTRCGRISTRRALDAAIASYRERERRFGRTSEQLASAGRVAAVSPLADARSHCSAAASLSAMFVTRAADGARHPAALRGGAAIPAATGYGRWLLPACFASALGMGRACRVSPCGATRLRGSSPPMRLRFCILGSRASVRADERRKCRFTR